MAPKDDWPGLAEAILTDHALEQIQRRQITPNDVREVLRNPQMVVPVRPGRVVAQSLAAGPNRHQFLLRVFVDVDRTPHRVVTAYRTSKIDKYGSRP